MLGKKAMIIDHSIFARHQSDLLLHSSGRMKHFFHLTWKVDHVLFLGKGDTSIKYNEKEDLKDIEFIQITQTL